MTAIQAKHYVQFLQIQEWLHFQIHVSSHRRFFYSPRFNEYLDEIVTMAGQFTRQYDTGEIFFRARLGCENVKERTAGYSPKPYKDMGVPPESKRVDGRATPIGIGYLYLSTDEETAVAESKPYTGAYVSVAQFILKRQVKMADFNKGEYVPLKNWWNLTKNNDVDSERMKRIMWGIVGNGFSKPVSKQDEDMEYLPTQVVAEKLMDQRFDGIIYRSMLTSTKGLNAVLFDKHVGGQIENSQKLVEVESVRITII